MLNQPTSSPMMKTMFGFLPFFPFLSFCSSAAMNCLRSAPPQQPSSLPDTAGVSARADHSAESWPDAASHPPIAPTTSATGTARFLTRNITFLLRRQGRGGGRNKAATELGRQLAVALTDNP